ncbi:MAG: hypothetical protein A7315_14000 [Candidatus Altiarchaeales archaeon WOR_SM1_79]|nr:MAG: hypothetical protein A7315_14000 [Candidatus Altiarchaeales archaeon WOR_SM1_79]
MNIGLLIPQVFYDLIARVVPGLTIFATSYFVWKCEGITTQDIHMVLGWFVAKDSPFILTIITLLLISYILALVIEGLWALLSSWHLFKKNFKKLFESYPDTDKILSEFKKLNPEFDDENYKFPSTALMHDAVRLKSPSTGSRLVKLRAEIHMCRVLILGWSILAAVNLLNLLKIGTLYSTVALLEVSLLIAILTISLKHRIWTKTFRWSICNHWLLLVKPGFKTFK